MDIEKLEKRMESEGFPTFTKMIQAIITAGLELKTGGVSQPNTIIQHSTLIEALVDTEYRMTYDETEGSGDAIVFEGKAVDSRTMIYMDRKVVTDAKTFRKQMNDLLGDQKIVPLTGTQFHSKQGVLTLTYDGPDGRAQDTYERINDEKWRLIRQYDSSKDDAEDVNPYLPEGIREKVAEILGLNMNSTFHNAFDKAVSLMIPEAAPLSF